MPVNPRPNHTYYTIIQSKRAKSSVKSTNKTTLPQKKQQTQSKPSLQTSFILPNLHLSSLLLPKFRPIKMPSFIQIEQNDNFNAGPPYEPGWNYVERRGGQMVLARAKKPEGRFALGGGWRKEAPKRKEGQPQRKVYFVEDEEPHRQKPMMIHQIQHHQPQQPGQRLVIDVRQPDCHRRNRSWDSHSSSTSSSSSSYSGTPTPKPQIRVRRPLLAPPSPASMPFSYERVRPRFADHQNQRPQMWEKIPLERARLRRIKPVQVMEQNFDGSTEYDYGCEDDEFELVPVGDATAMGMGMGMGMRGGGDKLFMEAREQEVEDSQWDEDMQAWVVRRSPRVRFCG